MRFFLVISFKLLLFVGAAVHTPHELRKWALMARKCYHSQPKYHLVFAFYLIIHLID